MDREYQICTKCIMDTTDPEIRFDENGICNHCRGYDELIKEYLFLNEAGQQKLKNLIKEIKKEGKNKKYDCIIGVSGGVDSTFTAYKVKGLGLRSLAVHLDNGWDAELTVSNIEKILKILDIDFYDYVIDWEEFKDLQLSFLKSSISSIEVLTDHAIWATLYHTAAKMRIKYIIVGSNFVTEGILPVSWGANIKDWGLIKSIHNKFGSVKLKSFPRMSLFKYFYYLYIKKIKYIPILNYIPYRRDEAIKTLERELGWKYYGGKHHESIFTRFFQAYILPKKFNIDKRRAHLSTLICSGQMSREKALEEMKEDIYPTPDLMAEDKKYVIKKLGITEDEFEKIMSLPIKTFRDYSANYDLLRIIQKFKIGGILRKLKIF